MPGVTTNSCLMLSAVCRSYQDAIDRAAYGHALVAIASRLFC